ncbi:MAG: ABC transporter ATP-binding protein [Clostridia bacterium]
MKAKQFFLGSVRQLIGLCIAALVVSISEVLLALSMKRALEMLIQQEKTGLPLFVVLFLGVILLSGIGYLIFGVFGAKFKKKFLSDLKRDYAKTMLDMSMDSFAKYSRGTIASGISNDINKLETQYLDTIIKIIKQSISFVLSGLVLLYFNPLLALCIYAFALTIVFAPHKTHKEMHLLGQKYSIAMAEYNTKVQEILGGFILIKVSNLGARFGLELDDLNRKSEKVRYDLGIKESVLTSVLAILSLMAFYVPFVIGTIFVYLGKVELGVLIVIVNLSGSIINPIQQIGINLGNLKAGRGILNSLLDFIHVNSENSSVTNIENPEIENHENPPDFHDSLSFNEVEFGYADRKVISGFSANIKKGSKALVVGASGSGKTTILNLISGLYPDYYGSITIDGNEIRNLSREFLSAYMSVVPQDSFIFNCTVKENIVLSYEYDNERLEKVCREALLEDLLQTLPEGIETMLGEGAQNLSGGERQRIGIARALYQNAPIILADEPTSSLDEPNSEMIFDILLKSNTTVICVTHKISDLQRRQFDLVIQLGE